MSHSSFNQAAYYPEAGTQLTPWLIGILFSTLFTIAAFVILPTLNYKKPKNPDPVLELEFMPWQKVQAKPSPPKPIKKPVIKPRPRPKPVVKPKPKPLPPKPVIAETTKPKPEPLIQEEVAPEPEPEPIKPEPVAQTPVAEPVQAVETETLPTPVPVFQLSNLPRFMHKVNPVYPPALKAQGISGKVKLSVLIDATGKVRDIKIVSSSHPEFAQAAIEAIQNSSFTSADINGRPVATLYKIPFRFRLQ